MNHPSQNQYQRWTRIATQASLATAVTLIVLKLLAWLASGSASLLGSLTDSLMDAAASLITFYALRIAILPADDEHRFGHGKAEPLATLVQAGFILGSAFLLMFAGINRSITPIEPTASAIGIGVSMIAIVLTLGLLALQRHAVAMTNSTAIAADALHYRSDLLLNMAVIVALLLAQWGWWWVDGAAAILIALYIGYGAWQLGEEAVHLLLDREVDDEIRAHLMMLVTKDPRVLGVHDFRTRQSGNTLYVQLHLDLDGELSLNRAHAIADAAEQRIKCAYEGADVIVHQDPYVANGPPL